MQSRSKPAAALRTAAPIVSAHPVHPSYIELARSMYDLAWQKQWPRTSLTCDTRFFHVKGIAEGT